MTTIESTPEFATQTYESMAERLAVVRQRMNRPLSLAEKVLLSHLDDPEGQEIAPGESYIRVRPDRVILQDVLGQTAMLQFMQTLRDRVAVPTTVHCDHLIQARAEGRPRPARVARRKRRSLWLPALRLRPIRRRLLGAGRGHHPSGRSRKLRLPRTGHHRHRLPHPERRRAGRLLRRRRRRGRGGSHGGAALGRPYAQAHRRRSDRQAQRLDGAQRRDSQTRRAAHRFRRHQQHHRVHRRRNPQHQLHRQGDNHQHGRGTRRDDFHVPIRPEHGGLPSGDEPPGPSRSRRQARRYAPRRSRSRSRPGQLLRSGGPHRPCDAGTPRRRPPLAGQGASHIRARRRSRRRRQRIHRRHLSRANRFLPPTRPTKT